MDKTKAADILDVDVDVKVDPKRLRGIKPLRRLLPLLASLHEVGCGRDAAGNRELHFDQYVTLVLLWMFNPMLDSVRALQKAAELENISEQLGVKRFSLGSFSESVRVFDPDKLKAVVNQLAGELKAVNADGRLKDHLFGQALKIVDATVLDAIATVAQAAWLPFQDGTAKHAWKLHVNFDFDSFLPDEVELTDARNSGKSDEKNVLRKQLRRDCCYVTDRWGTPAEYRRGPLRAVHAVQPDQRHWLQLRLPGQGEQRLRSVRGAAAQ